MRKQFIIAFIFSITAFSFAQKKELKAAEKAIKNQNYVEAKAALSQAEGLMSAMDEKSKEKFYFLNGQALYAGGEGSSQDIEAAIDNLGKVKNGYKAEIATIKQNMVNNFLTKGNTAYESENYNEASSYFEHAYKTNKKDTVYLYYAAATAVTVPDYDRALVLYDELKKLGYTGIAEQFYAVGKEDGEEELFPNKGLRDIAVKQGTHIKPTDKKSESKKAEIVKNVALIYVSTGDNEKAIAAMKDARAESPDDVNLILTEANVHFKMGNTEKFKSLLEEATKMDPNNPELQYNLGVVAAESNDIESAKSYYKKAIELDPNFINAYINMAAVILGEEEGLIEEMNGLGSSAADDKRYDELKEERQQLYRDAIPFLSKALEMDAGSVSAATTLMNIYSVLGETDKYKEMKAKVDSMKE
ncbi:tetratricopeptide repeat protein [Hyunsoonleella aestuarii]|uniref:Tetratricopeptide repeat protein n=1 Tax=Hyunsoonleella aestuarii TaxID=912802 RepID=A0ABP8EDA3_9FLAO|nr:tetratricopeptide repeat protein [Hyunsoonleella aestuarii]